MCFDKKNIVYKALFFLSLLLTVLSGSRNALLAMILTEIIIYMVVQKKRKNSISGGIKILLAACMIVFVGSIAFPLFGLDLSRYDYITLISSGGSNRTLIWETVLPIVWDKYMWFGYGPSHFCSEQIISSLLGQEYAHMHNTLFEAWGELGCFGLIPFLLILLCCLKKSCLHIKTQRHYSMISFLFIEFLFLGFGESFFANIELWIIIGFLLNGMFAFGNKKKIIS